VENQSCPFAGTVEITFSQCRAPVDCTTGITPALPRWCRRGGPSAARPHRRRKRRRQNGVRDFKRTCHWAVRLQRNGRICASPAHEVRSNPKGPLGRCRRQCRRAPICWIDL
jgi:hypothetical protein